MYGWYDPSSPLMGFWVFLYLLLVVESCMVSWLRQLSFFLAQSQNDRMPHFIMMIVTVNTVAGMAIPRTVPTVGRRSVNSSLLSSSISFSQWQASMSTQIFWWSFLMFSSRNFFPFSMRGPRGMNMAVGLSGICPPSLE